jgi:hypothetical protein
MTSPRPARFNHVAMSVPADLLGEEGRRDIVAFYGEVFGWQELTSETVDRRQLILSAYRYDQFVFLTAAEQPMQAPRLDHFGMGVAAPEDLDGLYQRALDYRQRDVRVDIIDKTVDHYPGLVLTSFYVGFLLPLMVEVQHFAFER